MPPQIWDPGHHRELVIMLLACLHTHDAPTASWRRELGDGFGPMLVAATKRSFERSIALSRLSQGKGTTEGHRHSTLWFGQHTYMAMIHK